MSDDYKFLLFRPSTQQKKFSLTKLSCANLIDTLIHRFRRIAAAARDPRTGAFVFQNFRSIIVALYLFLLLLLLRANIVMVRLKKIPYLDTPKS